MNQELLIDNKRQQVSNVYVLEYLWSYEKKVIDFYNKNFSILSTGNTKVHIQVISAMDIEHYEIDINNTQKETLEKVAILAGKLNNKYRDKLHNELNGSKTWLYRRLLECFDALRTIHTSNSKDILGWCIPKLEDFKHTAGYEHDQEALDDIEDMLALLKMIKIKDELLGCYSRNNKTIYICTEKILATAERNSLDFLLLVESVFVHEYAHFLHYENITQAQRNIRDPFDSIRRTAVFETVAEYCQMKHAIESNNQSLLNWMHSHQNTGYFPGWGYKGAHLVQNAEDILFVSLIDEVIAKSKRSWRDAYGLIVDSNLIASLKKRSYN